MDTIDMTIRDKLKEAVREPAAPTALVRRTVTRVNAIRKGQDAEEHLRRLGDKGPSEETRLLAAQGAVGRLMQNLRVPDGVTGELLVSQLAALPDFVSLTDRPANEVLSDLESGRLTRTLAGKAAKQAAQCRTVGDEGRAAAAAPPVKAADVRRI